MVLKSFDFFRKIHTQQELSSATGGAFTIGSFIVAGILVLLSIQDFTSIHYATTLRVKNDPTEYIPMRIDITFSKAPCQLITIQFHDELEFVEPGLQKKLQRFNIQNDVQTPYQGNQFREQQRNRANEGIDKNRQCRLQGVLNLPKTPGTLTFDTNGPGNLAQQLDHNKRMSIKSSYLLKKMQFGEALKPFQLPVTHSSQTVQDYIKKLEGDFASRPFVQDFRNKEQRQNYYNHLKIIPIYVDDGTYTSQKDRQKYRYSLRMSSTITRGASPVLEIYTDIEPINIVYTKNNMTFYDLCVDILAIAGGSVATIGVLNAFYHYLFGIK